MTSNIIEPARRKKTKLEKIAELESKVKILNEENIRYRREIHTLKSTGTIDSNKASEFSDSGTSGGKNGNEEKLKDALRSLKRVTVKQEMSLSSLRAKGRQWRAELEQKDKRIEQLERELKAMERAHEKLRGAEPGDVGTLKSKLADLELTLAREEIGKREQSKQLLSSKEDISTLRNQLDKMKGKTQIQRVPSVRSLRSTDSSNASSSEDVARLKRELAKKTEKIAALESDLDEAQDQIHQLKQKKTFDQTFPTTPALSSDDFFSDNDEEEDDFWAIHSPSRPMR